MDFKREELDAHETKGKHLRQSRSLIPHNSNVHTSLKWHMFPLEFEYFLDACMKPKCLRYFSRNLSVQDHQFVIDRTEDTNIFEIIRGDYTQRSQKQELKRNIWDQLRYKMRLASNMKLINAKQINALHKKLKFNVLKDSQTWKLTYSDGKVSIHLTAHMLITPGSVNNRYVENHFGQPSQSWITAHISDLMLSIGDYQLDIFGLLEPLYKTYSFQLELIDQKKVVNEKIQYVELLNSSMVQYDILSY